MEAGASTNLQAPEMDQENKTQNLQPVAVGIVIQKSDLKLWLETKKVQAS